MDKLIPLTFGASARGWHEMEPLVTCPKAYQYARVRGISERSPMLAEPLSIGLLVHAGRAQWLADGRKGDRWRAALSNYGPQLIATGSKPLAPAAIAVATPCMEEYVRYWSIRPCTEVLAVEYELEPRGLVGVSEEFEWRTARYDSVERYRGKTWIGECKTTSSGVANVRDTYALNGQTLLQCSLWGPREDAKFGKLEGVLLDIIKKPNGKSGAKCYPREPLPLSEMKHALEWFKDAFADWSRQARLITWDAKVPRNVTACMGRYGSCTYRSLCLRGHAGSVGFIFNDTGAPISTKDGAWK